MTQPNNQETRLRQFILENYLFTQDPAALDNRDSFLQTGILDSMGILEVIYFLEEEFGIKVEDDEMVPKNLDSINNLLAYTDRKSQTIGQEA